MSKIYIFTAKPVPGNKGVNKVIMIIGAKNKPDAAKHALQQGRDLVLDVGQTFTDRDDANETMCDISLILDAHQVVVDLNMQRNIGRLLGL